MMVARTAAKMPTTAMPRSTIATSISMNVTPLSRRGGSVGGKASAWIVRRITGLPFLWSCRVTEIRGTSVVRH